MNNFFLSDFQFSNRFTEVGGIRIHYIDEGNRDGPVILFLHGVPTWSYTFRNIFPICLSSGNRIVAPDIPGFGMSDKNLDPQRFTLASLSEWLSELFITLKLNKVFIFGHDWGVLLGMILAAKHPVQISGIIACNGFLPVIPAKAPLSFHLWRLFARFSPYLPIGTIINMGCRRKLSEDEKNGYNYPFSKSDDKIAVRILPGLIPLKIHDHGADIIEKTWESMSKWHKPFLTLFSDRDPITRGGHLVLQQKIPGTKNQSCRILRGGHFIQEDAPLEIGEIINDFVRVNS